MNNSYGFPERITVLNDNNKFLSYTHPARARKLLKDRKAEIFSKDPFTIKLKGGGNKMIPTSITNFTEYFSGGDRDVYIQNISTGQVSMQFEVSPGRFDSVPIPKTRKPFNLTQYIPFDAIKNSTDLRKLVNRRPPVIRLMSEEEYTEYYENLAKSKNTSIDEEINESFELQSNMINRRGTFQDVDKSNKSIDELINERNENPEEAMDIQPLPKVVGLCAQVGPDVENSDKIKSGEMMSELEDMETELRLTDLEYIASKGYYKSIKKWASTRLSDVNIEESK